MGLSAEESGGGAGSATSGRPASGSHRSPFGDGGGAARRDRSASGAVSRVAFRRGVVVWSVLIGALVVLEAFAYVRQPDWLHADPDHPTLSILLDPALEEGPVRFLGWLVWLALGWWVVTRWTSER